MRIGPRKAMEVLRRRLLHLEDRIATTHGEDLSFDRRECGALRSGIEALEAQVIPAEGDAVAVRKTRHGGAQVIVVRDGEVYSELTIEDGGRNVQVWVKGGDVRVNWVEEPVEVAG